MAGLWIAVVSTSASLAAPAEQCSRIVADTCDIRQLWLDYNESHLLHRTIDHADHYQTHLPPRTGSGMVKLLEIGIQSGGSARAWKQWFGERLDYTGIDIEPSCKRTQSLTENMKVEIGSQMNETFLQQVCKQHGPFDVIIDDGAHRPEMMIASLKALWPSSACMADKALYVIEDMQTMVMKKYASTPSDMYDIVGEAFWSMHYHWAYISPTSGSVARYGLPRGPPKAGEPKPLVQHPIFKNLVSAVHAYDSIAFFQRGKKPKPREVSRGSDSIGYGKGHPNNQHRHQAGLAAARKGISALEWETSKVERP